MISDAVSNRLQDLVLEYFAMLPEDSVDFDYMFPAIYDALHCADRRCGHFC